MPQRNEHAALAGERGGGVRPRFRPAARVVADLLLRPVEPSVHLPELRGRFLLLGSRDDPQIPSTPRSGCGN